MNERIARRGLILITILGLAAGLVAYTEVCNFSLAPNQGVSRKRSAANGRFAVIVFV